MRAKHQMAVCGLEARPLPGQREIFFPSASTGHQQRDGGIPAAGRIHAREVLP